jgi:hypothetical protein
MRRREWIRRGIRSGKRGQGCIEEAKDAGWSGVFRYFKSLVRLLPSTLFSNAAEFLRRFPERAWSGSLAEVTGGLSVIASVVSEMSGMGAGVVAFFRFRHWMDVLVGSGGVAGGVVQCSIQFVSVLFLWLFLRLHLFRGFGGHS